MTVARLALPRLAALSEATAAEAAAAAGRGRPAQVERLRAQSAQLRAAAALADSGMHGQAQEILREVELEQRCGLKRSQEPKCAWWVKGG